MAKGYVVIYEVPELASNKFTFPTDPVALKAMYWKDTLTVDYAGNTQTGLVVTPDVTGNNNAKTAKFEKKALAGAGSSTPSPEKLIDGREIAFTTGTKYVAILYGDTQKGYQQIHVGSIQYDGTSGSIKLEYQKNVHRITKFSFAKPDYDIVLTAAMFDSALVDTTKLFETTAYVNEEFELRLPEDKTITSDTICLEAWVVPADED